MIRQEREYYWSGRTGLIEESHCRRDCCGQLLRVHFTTLALHLELSHGRTQLLTRPQCLVHSSKALCLVEAVLPGSYFSGFISYESWSSVEFIEVTPLDSKEISSWSRQGDWKACVVQARPPAASFYLTYFIPGGEDVFIDPETLNAKPEGEF